VQRELEAKRPWASAVTDEGLEEDFSMLKSARWNAELGRAVPSWASPMELIRRAFSPTWVNERAVEAAGGSGITGRGGAAEDAEVQAMRALMFEARSGLARPRSWAMAKAGRIGNGTDKVEAEATLKMAAMRAMAEKDVPLVMLRLDHAHSAFDCSPEDEVRRLGGAGGMPGGPATARLFAVAHAHGTTGMEGRALTRAVGWSPLEAEGKTQLVMTLCADDVAGAFSSASMKEAIGKGWPRTNNERASVALEKTHMAQNAEKTLFGEQVLQGRAVMEARHLDPRRIGAKLGNCRAPGAPLTWKAIFFRGRAANALLAGLGAIA
ncbi:unnamed protein product, partial [Prorocentrum cordatum]